MSQLARVTGQRELIRKFRKLRDKDSRKALRKGVTAGLKVVEKEIKAAAPESGRKRGKNKEGKRYLSLKRSIGSRFKRNSKTGELTAMSGIAVKKKRAVVARHAHLVALGTAVRRNKKGANRGRVTPRPFVDIAFLRAQARARAVILSATKQLLEKSL